MKISILCASKNSIYNEFKNVEVFDKDRDTNTFTGGTPVICHPPCRGYSAFMRHFSNPEPGEKKLAFTCLRHLLKYGGVLEHPAHSRFVKRVMHIDAIDVHQVNQSWWGYPTTKKTWLITPEGWHLPEIPFQLEQYGKEREIFEGMSHRQRSYTTYQFADWLIELVKQNMYKRGWN